MRFARPTSRARADTPTIRRRAGADGTIDPADHKLAIELASPGFHLNKRNKLVIESKSMTARGLASPDRADALCLTFAMPVSSKPKLRLVSSRDAVMPTGTSSWMGP